MSNIANKAEFIETLKELYRIGNCSDSDNPENWTHPDMAGESLCRPLDMIFERLRNIGFISNDEHSDIYDTL